MKLSTKSLAIGALAAFSSFAMSYAAHAFSLVGLSRVLYWQGWWLQQAFIPCLNIDTSERPLCEGSPLNLVVFFLGLPFGVVLYSLVALGALAIWGRRGA
jgi:hypothetical protein